METIQYQVAGLKKSVEILVDRWGIPHIYAEVDEDIFFAQGFNAARDRLWQIDLWRRRGLGKLSEVFGAEYVEQDRAARLFVYRGEMDKEWASYSAETEEIVTSFVAGINAFIDLTKQYSELIPKEFVWLDYSPDKWEPEDVVKIRSHGLRRNLEKEVARALTLQKHGIEAEQIRQRLEPEWSLDVPEGLDVNDIPENVLEIYLLATQEVVFEPEEERIKMVQRNLQQQIQQIKEDTNLGSNNWVISAEKSKTGRPILANDPHRAMNMPSLRYMVHLSSPGLDVIGGGEPVLPGISLGHNGFAAFGFTIFGIDQEDLYVYEMNPDNLAQYWYKGEWEDITVIKEEIKVRDGEAQVKEMEYTRHGPLIYRDEQKHRAFAVRAAWLEAGMSPYLGSMSYMGAKDWNTFSEATNNWGAPAENLIYADMNGNIGWSPGGLTPVRENWDGLLPVPGDGRYEWNGFMDQSKLPLEHNPERGWIATANEMNLPQDFPYETHKPGFEWAIPYRYQRIAEVLGSMEKSGIEDSVALQSDYLSIPARRITKLLEGLHSDNDKINRALQTLTQWDNVLDADSPAAALFEVWYQHHLLPAVVAQILPTLAAKDVDAGDPVTVVSILENPEEKFGSNPNQVREKLILSSLQTAIKQLEEQLSPDMEQWKWGDLHQMHFVHPLSPLVDEKTRDMINVGPILRGGSGDTVGCTNYDRRKGYGQHYGASFRMVLDVGSWDDSVAVNSPGQSGDPASPHYRELAKIWADDEATPLLYSREKIEESTEQKIVLMPG